LPQGAIQRHLKYVQELYQREDAEIENCYVRRPNKYLLKEEMDHFVAEASRLLEQVHRAATDGDLNTQRAMSVFELESFAPTVGG
jgi:hypothetical protein